MPDINSFAYSKCCGNLQADLHFHPLPGNPYIYTWSDNKVRKLATVCSSWQRWTETSVWFDDGISVFHSCVVVWQSLSEWRLLLSECVLVCHRENVGAYC
jgi:hypothetical protein